MLMVIYTFWNFNIFSSEIIIVMELLYANVFLKWKYALQSLCFFLWIRNQDGQRTKFDMEL
jgi:hypothetical protein